MCVVSMIMDYYNVKWQPQPYQHQYIGNFPQPQISQAEVDEFRRLLERAREYDKRNNEPDCELDEKRQALKKIADAAGIDISFL